MAGIGFEIRKILDKKSILATVEAYSYAGLIGSGPWILSIVGLSIVGLMSAQVINTSQHVIEFLVSVTYLMAGSIIISGGLQLMLTRFISDQLFLEKIDSVLPNLLGSMISISIVSVLFGITCLFFFEGNTILTHILMLASFVCLSNLWLLIVFMSGMREFKRIVLIMAQGYILLIVLAWFLRQYSMEGLMMAFFLSQAYLLFAFLFLIIINFLKNKGEIISFDFLKPQYAFYSLFVCGTLYNLGMWVDKIVFWLAPSTSENIIGWFRASIIYDVPIFLAYLSIIPSIAVFLIRIETDFAELHERYYKEVRGMATLETLLSIKVEMVDVVRLAMGEIIKVQAVVIALLIMWGKPLLSALGVDTAYYALFSVDLVGVGIQVLFLSMITVLFYFDKRFMAVVLAATFCFCNATFSALSILAGPEFYGYGFLVAGAITSAVGFAMLNNVFKNLEYNTYMMQK